MCAQREFTIPISTKCPSGGIKTIRPSDDNPAVVYVRADGRGGINCSRTSGCGKRHSKNDFKGDPVILKIFDDAVNYYKKSNTTQSSETTITPTLNMSSSVPQKKRGRPPTKLVDDHKKKVHTSREDFYKIVSIIVQLFQDEVNAAPKVEKKEKDVASPSYKSKIFKMVHGDDVFHCKCPVCQTTKIFRDDYSLGHIFPENYGGDMNVQNLLPICADCNSAMGDKHLYYFAWTRYRRILFDFSKWVNVLIPASTEPTPAPTAS
jgi:5-methylcytosine-specific restriction endonuclease McrA